jgi:D-psicose/D-tagatose/L-ribulose 3-epimerase
VNLWIWESPITDAVIADLVPRVADLGFDVVELPVEEPGAWDPDLARDAIARAGLGVTVCSVMPAGRDLAVADSEVVARTQDYLRHCVEVATQVGSRTVAGPMYASVGRLWRLEESERSETLALVAERLRPIAEFAGERRVRLAVEPLNRYETSLVNTVEQALALIEALDHPAGGLLLDTFHLNIEEKRPADAARLASGHIAHVHACGTDRGAPGMDSFDWPEFLAALDEAGYRGPLCIESFTSSNEVIATAASIWRPLAESPDALARDGLRFLRGLVR